MSIALERGYESLEAQKKAKACFCCTPPSP